MIRKCMQQNVSTFYTKIPTSYPFCIFFYKRVKKGYFQGKTGFSSSKKRVFEMPVFTHYLLFFFCIRECVYIYMRCMSVYVWYLYAIGMKYYKKHIALDNGFWHLLCARERNNISHRSYKLSRLCMPLYVFLIWIL